MLEQDYGSWRMPWAEVNRFQRLTGDLDHPFSDTEPSLGVAMASARWGALAAYGSRRFADTKKLLSLIHISEPTRLDARSRMPSSA